MSGRERGVVASVLRGALSIASVGYGAAMRVRNWWYDTDRARIEHVDALVVCVGNLTLGGTGKTPMVEWIVRWMRERGVRPAVVSRGYGAQAGAANDEARELADRLPGVPQVQNRDRAAAARRAIDEFGAQVIVLDDGFQHRRLARELDVVMLDAAEPWGYEHVFPRGMLREPPSGLTRAEVVVLSRADMVDDARRAEIRRRAERLSHGAVWAEVVHAPQRWLAAGAGAAALDELCGQRVAAFCGIGNPRGFRHTLDRCGCEVAALREFPDHHAYTPSDLEQLAAWAAASGATAIVCTHKDLVKIGVDRLGALPLWALVVGIEFLEGQVELEAKLAWLIARLPRCSEP